MTTVTPDCLGSLSDDYHAAYQLKRPILYEFGRSQELTIPRDGLGSRSPGKDWSNGQTSSRLWILKDRFG